MKQPSLKKKCSCADQFFLQQKHLVDPLLRRLGNLHVLIKLEATLGTATLFTWNSGTYALLLHFTSCDGRKRSVYDGRCSQRSQSVIILAFLLTNLLHAASFFLPP